METTPRPLARLALLGAAVPAGWMLYDLIRVACCSRPDAFLPLFPGALLVLALGAAAGYLCARQPWLGHVALASAAVASAVPAVVELGFTPVITWAPRVVFLLLAVWVLAARLDASGRGGALRLALCGGFLTAHLPARQVTASALPLELFAVAVVALLLGLVPRPWIRRVATALLLIYPLAVIAERVEHHRGARRQDLPPGGARAEAGAPNLLLVVMDTVRADRLAPYGYERVTTPQLDAFAGEHMTRYTHSWSAASYTLPSHASMLTGLHSAVHGAHHPRTANQDVVAEAGRPAVALREDVPTLAERMRERGYRTGAIVANSAYLNHHFGLARGFEHYDDRDGAWIRKHRTLPQYLGWLPRLSEKIFRSGAHITDAALAWIEGGREPFFLMLNYMDAHAPYIPPPETEAAFSDEQPFDPREPERELWPLLYDRCLLGLDLHLGRLLDELNAAGLLDRTALIITADHGEAMGEHGWWTHAWILNEEVVRVPLYVKPAGGRTRAVDDRHVDGTHVPHLAFSTLGLESEPPRDALPGGGELVSEWYAGQSSSHVERWAEENGRNVEADLVAWVENGVKHIVHSSGRVLAYDLARDPDERDPLPLTEAQREDALERARSWWERHPPLEQDQEAALDPELQRRLETLGYMGDR